MADDKRLLEFAQFVTDKFAVNHSPWVYSRDLGNLKHIRYESDYTGRNHWTKRVRRFIRDATVRHWKEDNGLLSRLKSDKEKTFWHKLTRWPMMIAVSWSVHVVKAKNLPDGKVGPVITNWEEDGEYIMLFGPTVGREVLKFLNAEPDNEHARAIVKAMHEAAEASNYT